MKIIIALSYFLLTSCATIFTGTTQKIVVQSVPDGATVSVNGMQYGQTPMDLKISRTVFSDKTLMVELDGYKTEMFILPKKFNYVSILNFFNWVGWGIDVISGAVVKYDRDYIMLNMKSNQLNSYNLHELNKNDLGYYILPEESNSFEIVDKKNNMKLVFTE